MAVKLFASAKEMFKVVSSRDESLAGDFSREEYESYLKDLDENKLRRKPENTEPFTYFHFKPSLSVKESLRKNNKIASLGIKAQKGGDFPYFEALVSLVESTLVDITCGDQSLMQKKEDGSISDELLLGLIENQILSDLASAVQLRSTAPSSENLELTKKN